MTKESNITQLLKKLLWERYGTKQYPAEWDGNVYGGGKISQRFWEYFQAIQDLNLLSTDVILDIGGGSPQTGLSLFPRILVDSGIQTIVMDRHAKCIYCDNLTIIDVWASKTSIKEVMKKHPVTHISCISVLEHINTKTAEEIMETINVCFKGNTLFFSFEYHPIQCFFENQLTAQTMNTIFSKLTNFYLDNIQASPTYCINAFNRPPVVIPLWYPLAVCFKRKNEDEFEKTQNEFCWEDIKDEYIGSEVRE